jgi:hypothetical protein
MLRYRVERECRAGTLLVALLLWTTVSAAQIANPSNPSPLSNPLRPALAAPEGVIRTDPALPVTLQWRQQEIAPTSTNAAARYFLLCVYVRATSDCASAPLRWLHSATRIQRAAVTRPSTSGPPFVTAYDYTFSIVLSPEMIDQQVDWRVGACGSERESSCTFITTPVWFSTHNLTAMNISDGFSTPRMLYVSGEVRNGGMNFSGPFETKLTVYNALLDESGRCLTDLTAEGLGVPEAYVLTDEGERIFIPDLPRDANGRPDARPHVVRAIVGGNAAEVVTSVHGGLSAGDSATVVEATHDVFSGPIAFGTLLHVDSSNALAEYDESDNTKGECHIIYPK